MKTADLTGALLDYWVARAETKGKGMRWEQQGRDWIGFGTIGSSPEFAFWIVTDATLLHDRAGLSAAYPSARFYSPSTNWAQGGPILERMRLLEANGCVGGMGWYVRGPWAPCDGDQVYGDTLLEAAMRSYVLSKFGREVPDEGAAIQAAAQGEQDA